MNFLRRLLAVASIDAPRPEPLRSIVDRLDFAAVQLQMVKESTGRITEGDVRKAAANWSDDDNEEQYQAIKFSLMELVTA
jgi:hypothetical protein